jgi:hypothetical protein
MAATRAETDATWTRWEEVLFGRRPDGVSVISMEDIDGSLIQK